MTTVLLNYIWRFLSLSWLTGAIFEKELRVASRQRRNYVLRFSYISLLTIILAMVWMGVVQYSGSALRITTQMSLAGQYIIVFIIWFQFCACQIVAGVMLSTSISDEIYHKTLGLLMTTPINSFQIVIGKLLSKLLQLFLLLAISLPLLAIVRVFGGVPWGYVVSSLCITLTTIIFVGSLSLFFSIFNRRAYLVIIMTVLTMVALFALLPFLTAWIWYITTGNWPGKALTAAIFVPNPYFNLFVKTLMVLEPRSTAGAPMVIWPLNCCVMLAASAFILLLSIIMVRKVALRQVTGQLIFSSRSKRSRTKGVNISDKQQLKSYQAIRRIKGPPVLWKELRLPMLGRHKLISIIAIMLGIGLLLFTYLLCAMEDILDDEEVHILYIVVFLGLGTLYTIVLPATNITAEKESRSWPLLLTTTLDDWQILLGKFIGNMRRLLPVWCILFAHIIIFSIADVIFPFALIQIVILVTWLVTFLCCTGIYFSSRFKRTTTAVVMNFILAAVIWAMLPILLFLAVEIADSPDDFAEAYMDTNPFVHAIVIMIANTDRQFNNYDWIGLGRADFIESTIWMLVCMVGYVFLGVCFAWRAQCRFRRNIF